MAKEAIILPDIPSNATELEDYVAALFQAGGYFVQRGVIERDPTDVLELDVVATDYGADPPETIVAEAKSGDWGHPDIFKVAGWMCYLGIKRGGFFVRHVPPEKDFARTQERAEAIDIVLAHLTEPDLVAGFTGSGFPAPGSANALEVWRFVYILERCLLRLVRHEMKTQTNGVGPREVWQYFNLINNGIFFEPDDYERLSLLYDAFAKHPRLALGVAREIGGDDFDCNVDDPKNPVIREALYRCKHPLLQACFYIEHRARLAVLKAVVDIILLHPEPKIRIRIGKAKLTQLDMLPQSAREAIVQLRKHRFVRHYARFWQVFLWACGGFYLRDREKQEFEWLEGQTGVPAKEVPNALKAFDILFPMDGSWLVNAHDSECRVVKMVPCVMQGMGVFHRRLNAGLKTGEDFGYSDRTEDDLNKWYKAAYMTLRTYSGLEVEQEPS